LLEYDHMIQSQQRSWWSLWYLPNLPSKYIYRRDCLWMLTLLSCTS